MKAILFCANPYAFGILKPLSDELLKNDHTVLWYLSEQLESKFPFAYQNKTSSILDLHNFRSDVIFVPGNEVPHYLNGVKVQVFHGLAGEKKGHFRIRNYFDLYLTQGPYFTKRFKELAENYKDFEVTETGWCKLDILFAQHPKWQAERVKLLTEAGKSKMILYAPTFSPSLSSAKALKNEIGKLADNEDVLIFIKFHDLMNKRIIKEYNDLTRNKENVKIVSDPDVLKLLIMADLMISDTSSVVYEFVLLDKPVITLNSNSPRIAWRDIRNARELLPAYRDESTIDSCKPLRVEIFKNYHPYRDGQSSERMINAVVDFIHRNGVPKERRLNWWRRFKINSIFGKKRVS